MQFDSCVNTCSVDSSSPRQIDGVRHVNGSSTGNWIIFGVVIAVALAADLFLLHRKTERVTLKRALLETAGWIGLALLFGVWILVTRGHQIGVEYFTAYVLEKSLSADNIFVFLLIFQAFGIEPQFQHRVLYSGIVGALILRLAFVIAGIALLQRFHFVAYVFGALLIIFGVHMLLPGSKGFRPDQNWLMRLVRKIHPVDASYKGEKFWIRVDGRRVVTPLLLALVAIEAMDVVFAADSVPAVLSITRDPFIAYSSNVFAILGLRAMYFGLSDIMSRMKYLHQGLAVILVFVGGKMLASEHFPIPAHISLLIILAVLVVAGGASWIATRKTG
jgi:tellurite resistance protein TerC